MYHTLFFDLDNTLYPADSGLWEAIGERIESFLREEMSMQMDQISEFRLYCRDKFGTTLQGLKSLYEIDEAHYLQYVHAVKLSDYLHKDERLTALLESLPQRKIILTNSDENHAHNVLSYLEIEDYFEFIIDVNKLSPYVKPQKESFSKALNLAGISSPDGCVFMDDHLPSVLNAVEMGFFGILIGQDLETKYPHQIADIYRLPEILTEKQE